jgi:hypothetical protein
LAPAADLASRTELQVSDGLLVVLPLAHSFGPLLASKKLEDRRVGLLRVDEQAQNGEDEPSHRRILPKASTQSIDRS